MVIALLVLFIVLAIADILLTLRGRAMGLQEANPLLRMIDKDVVPIVQVGLYALAVYGFLQPGFSLAAKITMCVIAGLAVANNLVEIKKATP